MHEQPTSSPFERALAQLLERLESSSPLALQTSARDARGRHPFVLIEQTEIGLYLQTGDRVILQSAQGLYGAGPFADERDGLLRTMGWNAPDFTSTYWMLMENVGDGSGAAATIIQTLRAAHAVDAPDQLVVAPGVLARILGLTAFAETVEAGASGCVLCGNPELTPIMYGEPIIDPQQPNLHDGVIFGGCIIHEMAPTSACETCGARFGVMGLD
jgi:hypothetical protein